MRRIATVVMIGALGCGSSSTEPDPGPPDDPSCEPGELTLDDGACQPAGIPPDGCGEGFVHDGVGCEPLLPSGACAPGTMAAVGDTECHSVGQCDGLWPDVPLVAHHVSVTGGANADGSMAAPWPTIGEAVTAATAGDTIAVAAGTYAEDVVIDGKPLQLVGSCAGEVRIIGSAGAFATIDVRHATGSAVRGVAVSGPASHGIAVTDALDVEIAEVYLHEGGIGLAVRNDLGPVSVTLSDSLVEGAGMLGLWIVGAELAVERSMIRDTQSNTDGSYGRGIEAHFDDDASATATVTVTRSWITANRDVGIYLWGAQLTLEDSVVEDTVPNAVGGSGRGIDATAFDTAGPVSAEVSLSRSLLRRNRETGLYLGSSHGTLEAMTIRDQLPTDAGLDGRGISAASLPTLPDVSSELTVLRSAVVANHELGIEGAAATMTVIGSHVADTMPGPDGLHGDGIATQSLGGISGSLTIEDSVVTGNVDIGIRVVGSTLVMRRTRVDHTTPAVADGGFGDGIAVASYLFPAEGTITDSTVAHNARAGLAVFGGRVEIGANLFACNGVDLNGEQQDLNGVMTDFAFTDGGGNHCACNGTEHPCKALSSGLEPPAPLD